jgi:hypothetical protein
VGVDSAIMEVDRRDRCTSPTSEHHSNPDNKNDNENENENEYVTLTNSDTRRRISKRYQRTENNEYYCISWNQRKTAISF